MSEPDVGPVNPLVLRWARESTRLDVPTAAKAGSIANPDRLVAAESGTDALTLRQLECLAKAYKLPLTTFYLPEPPVEEPLPVDFRSADRTDYSSHLIRILREARDRRDTVEVLSRDLDIRIPRFPKVENDNEIISVLRPLVCVTEWDVQRAKQAADGARALNITKDLVERALPVLIFEYIVDPAHLRGCSLFSEPLSLVIISSRDLPNARRFTLVHELAHLLMRQSGLCSPLSDAQAEVERRCNWVAGESMLPAEEIVGIIDQESDLDKAIASIAKRYALSASAVAVRLRQLNFISSGDLAAKLDLYRQYFEYNRQRQKETEGGPNYHLLQTMRLGPTFAATILQGLSSDLLSITRAADLLGVRTTYTAFDAIRENAFAMYGR